MPDPVSDPDPTDPTKGQGPTHSEAAQQGASDETELTDEQLEKAAGGVASSASANSIDGEVDATAF